MGVLHHRINLCTFSMSINCLFSKFIETERGSTCCYFNLQFIEIAFCRLSLRHEDLRGSLTNLQISENEYNRLRRIPVQQLTLQQYTAVRKLEI